VLHGQKESVNILLAAGADPNAADASGTKPLQAALARGRSAIAVALEQSGAR
jgi:ankyrin repeat protein